MRPFAPLAALVVPGLLLRAAHGAPDAAYGDVAPPPRAGVTIGNTHVRLVASAEEGEREERERTEQEIRERYTKYEHFIPMRDGKRLFTAVYVPKDRSRPYPMMLNRTPYGLEPYGSDRYPARLATPAMLRAGYIFVQQDVRGCWMSEGEWQDVRPFLAKKSAGDVDESSDTYDTVEWLLRHVPGHNGKVGIWGISYPGFFATMGALDAHPALVAASPQAPIADWFVGDDFHHNGAFFLPHAFHFYVWFGNPRPYPTKQRDFPFDTGNPDGYSFFLGMGPLANSAVYMQGKVGFWRDLMAHGTYDAFWKARDVRPHLGRSRPATMVVGGWYDAEDLFGALETYKGIEAKAKGSNVLVMGPWRHGGWHRGDGDRLGDISFHAKTALFYQESIELPFFERTLKGIGKGAPPEAWVFETGANQWRTFDAWPPKQARPVSFFFGGDGKLLPEAPSEAAPGYDEYVSDPSRPVPYVEKVATRMVPEYMTSDQRFASRRPDVLVYTTAPLAGDVTVAGPIEVDLTVSTTGTDADFVVKLIDVHPSDLPIPEPNPSGVVLAGYQQLVRGEPMRGKFRGGLDKPQPFVPGEPTKVTFVMPDVLHTFRAGHRMMVHVQSSFFPLVDRNPQTFVDIYAAKEGDFRKATQRVYRERGRLSRIGVRVLPSP